MPEMRSLCAASGLAAGLLLLAMPAGAAKPQPVRPAGSPGEWISSDDYPADAMRAGAEGVTGFKLDIDKTGRVEACSVTTSSGNAALDAVSCTLLSARAHFLPALDRTGAAIASSYSSRIRWALPRDGNAGVAAMMRFASCMANDRNDIQVETATGCAH